MKIKILILLLFVSAISFGQNTHTQTYDNVLRNGATLSTNRTVNQNGNNLINTGGGNYQLDSLLFTKNTNMQLHSTPDSASGYGNSVTVGQGATTPTVGGYVYLLTNYYSLSFTNHALSGSGAWYSIGQHNLNINPPHAAMTIAMFGLNDVRRSATNNGHGPGSIGAIPAPTTDKICNALNAMFANQYLSSWSAAGSGSGITRYGSWSTSYNGASVGGKSHTDGSSTGAYTTTLGDSIVFTGTGTTFFIGGIAADGTVNTYSDSIQIFLDNVLQEVVSENFQTDGVSDGVNNNQRSPMGWFVTAASNGSHKIKLVNRNHGGFFMVLDYFGILVTPTAGQPFLMFEAPKLDSTGYATSPSDANDSVIHLLNNSIDSTAALFPANYPVTIIKTNNSYNVVGGISADNIHPNDTGHGEIASQAEMQVPLSSLSGLTGGTGNTLMNLSNVDNIRFVANTSTGVQQIAYLSDISGSSGLLGTINKLVKFGSSTTGTNSSITDNGSLISTAEPIAVTGAALLGAAYAYGAQPMQMGVIASTTFPSISWYNSSAGSDIKEYDQYVDNSGVLHFRLLNDAFNSAADWARYTRSTIIPSSGEFDIYSVQGFENAGAPTNTSYVGTSTDFQVFSINRNPITGAIGQTSKAAAQIALEGAASIGQINFYTTNSNNSAPTERGIMLGNGNMTWGTLLDSAALISFGAGTSSNAQLYLPPGTIMTTPKSGSLTHVNGHLWFTDQGTNYDLMAGGATTIYTGSSTLTSNRTVSAGGFNLSLGATGDKLSQLTVNSSAGISLQGQIQYGIYQPGDANIVVPNNVSIVELPIISANRTITMPTMAVGAVIHFFNTNTSNVNQWSITGVTVVDANGFNNISTLRSGRSYDVIYDGSIYILKDNGMGIPTQTLFTGTATTTVASSNTPTSIVGAGVGTMTIPANFLYPGKTLRIKIAGVYGLLATTPGNLTINLKIGSTTIATGTITNFIGTAPTNQGFDIEATVTCRTTGSSGTVMTDGIMTYENNATAFSPRSDIDLNNAGATTTVNTTTSNLIDCIIQWQTNSASNTISATIVNVEIVN